MYSDRKDDRSAMIGKTGEMEKDPGETAGFFAKNA
jgi:hypothetical protein